MKSTCLLTICHLIGLQKFSSSSKILFPAWLCYIEVTITLWHQYKSTIFTGNSQMLLTLFLCENLLLGSTFGARIICFYPCNYSFWRQKAAFSAENKACVALFVTRVLCTTTITTAAPNSRLVALEGYHHQHHPRSVKKPFLISTILYVSLSFLRLPLTQCHVTPHETSFTFRTPFKIKASLTSMTFAPFWGREINLVNKITMKPLLHVILFTFMLPLHYRKETPT